MKFIPKEYDFHPNEFHTHGINSASMYDFHTLCGTYADVVFLNTYHFFESFIYFVFVELTTAGN